MLCGACQEPVTIEYEINGERGGRYRLQKWTCPNCRIQNALNLAGQLIAARKRNPDTMN